MSSIILQNFLTLNGSIFRHLSEIEQKSRPNHGRGCCSQKKPTVNGLNVFRSIKIYKENVMEGSTYAWVCKDFCVLKVFFILLFE